MSLYLGTTPIANNSVSRNIGEIIQSTIPLTDAEFIVRFIYAKEN